MNRGRQRRRVHKQRDRPPRRVGGRQRLVAVTIQTITVADLGGGQHRRADEQRGQGGHPSAASAPRADERIRKPRGKSDHRTNRHTASVTSGAENRSSLVVLCLAKIARPRPGCSVPAPGCGGRHGHSARHPTVPFCPTHGHLNRWLVAAMRRGGPPPFRVTRKESFFTLINLD